MKAEVLSHDFGQETAFKMAFSVQLTIRSLQPVCISLSHASHGSVLYNFYCNNTCRYEVS
jgi:hypothetical protein